MNVAIFASAFYPSLGGVEELCRQLAHEYQRMGLGVIVLTNRWPRSIAAHEMHEGIPVYRVPMRVPSGNFRAHVSYHLTHRKLRREVAEILLRHQIDILHVQCVSATAVYALGAKADLGLPLVVTLQGELTMDATQLYQRSAYAQHMMRRSLDGADAITGCSRQTLQEAEDFMGSPFGDRGQVVYNGIRLKDFEKAEPFVHPRPYIFAIGRHVPQKGFDLLLRAVAAAGETGHDLILAGDGSERTNLESLAKELGIADRVTFVGRVGHDQAVKLFAGCSFFILPSRHEPFGIVNLEAMAAGKAVVASRVGGVPEFVIDGQTGILVEGDNIASLAAAIRQLTQDNELRNRLATAGQSAATAFDWSLVAGQYQAIYTKLASAVPSSIAPTAQRQQVVDE